MKKIYFAAIMVLAGFAGMAQDIDDIKDMMAKSQFKESKVAIDKYLSAPKNAENSDAWYLKGRIYNSLSYDNTTPESDVYNLRNEAFAAFQKYQQLDPKDLWMKLENFESYLNLYGGLYDLGAKFYNAKSYDASLNAFKKANEIKDFILSKKYEFNQVKLYPLDTALVLNAAVAAVQAKKMDEAIIFYRKLTDANVGGKDYEEVYEFLADHYSKKNDEASLMPLLEKAKKLYPTNEYWSDIEIRMVSNRGDQPALFAKYEEMIAREPSNFRLGYNYAVELYNSIYGRDAKNSSIDNLEYRNKLTNVLKNVVPHEKESEATMLMSNHLFNMAADLLNAANAIKSTKPDDVKKKAELKAASNKAMDECITYSEAAVKYFEAQPKLKDMQKANYKIVLGYLSDIYNLKNNPKKSAEYDAKNKSADKL
jgi:hypothetical protein